MLATPVLGMLFPWQKHSFPTAVAMPPLFFAGAMPRRCGTGVPPVRNTGKMPMPQTGEAQLRRQRHSQVQLGNEGKRGESADQEIGVPRKSADTAGNHFWSAVA